MGRHIPIRDWDSEDWDSLTTNVASGIIVGVISLALLIAVTRVGWIRSRVLALAKI